MRPSVIGKVHISEEQQQQNRKGDEYKQLPDQYRQSRDETAFNPLHTDSRKPFKEPQTKKEALAAPKNELFKNPAFTARIAEFSGDSSKSLLTQAKTSKSFEEGIQHYSEATWQRLLKENPDNAVADLCSAAEKGDDTAVITLVKEVLQSERSSKGNIVDVLEALGQVKPTDPDILKAITQLLQHPDWLIRYKAIHALGAIKPTNFEVLQSIVNNLDHIDPEIRASAISALVNIRPEDPELLQIIIRNHLKRSSWVENLDALYALGAIRPRDPEVLRMIIDYLRHPNQKICDAAIQVLGSIKPKDPEILQKIVNLLEHPDSDIRVNALLALNHIKPKDPKIHLAIAECLKDPVPKVRMEAIRALYACEPHDPVIHLAIAEFLKDPDSSIRFIAIRALGVCDPHDSAIHLAIAECLKDHEKFVRHCALDALRTIRIMDLKIYQDVSQFLQDSDYLTRDIARDFLNKNNVKHLILESLHSDSRKTVDMARDLIRQVYPNDPVFQHKLKDIEREMSLEREEMPGAAWLFDSSKQLYNYFKSLFKK